MTLQRISHSVSTARTSVIVAVLGAGLCATAVVVALVAGGNSGSPSRVGSPSLARIEVPSIPGGGALSERELVASAFAEHESYMEALFGRYVGPAWNAPVDVARAKTEHDALIDAVLRP